MNPASSPDQSYLKAALWMGGWLTGLVIMTIGGRETTSQLNAFQVVELRSVIGFFLLLPLVLSSGGFAAMKTARPWRHIWRNTVHYGAQYAWLAALALIPLAQVVSIEFTMPMWAALLAMFFLGEKMNRWKMAAILLGLAGVWVIVRPGVSHADAGQLLALFSAVGFGVSVILVKSLTRTEGVVRIIFWMLVIQSIIGLLPAILTWRPVPYGLWGWVVVVAFCGTFSHYCMAMAMRHAEAGIVVPMDFLRVPLTILAGWAVYNEAVDLYTIAGALLILAGNFLNLRPPRPPGKKRGTS